MSRSPLDLRFAIIVSRIATAHPDALPAMRRHATMFAEGCGRTLAREIGCAANLVVRARRRLGLPSPQHAHGGAQS